MTPGSTISPALKKKYTRLFRFLKQRRSAGDDALFADAHARVFAQTDCRSCAQCCKTHSPLFTERDIRRIAAHLRMRPADFMMQYLQEDTDGDWVFRQTPCPFLREDNLCGIYEVRPGACREYPHTNRKKMYRIGELTITNASICPAVSHILDAVYAALPLY